MLRRLGRLRVDRVASDGPPVEVLEILETLSDDDLWELREVVVERDALLCRGVGVRS